MSWQNGTEASIVADVQTTVESNTCFCVRAAAPRSGSAILGSYLTYTHLLAGPQCDSHTCGTRRTVLSVTLYTIPLHCLTCTSGRRLLIPPVTGEAAPGPHCVGLIVACPSSTLLLLAQMPAQRRGVRGLVLYLELLSVLGMNELL